MSGNQQFADYVQSVAFSLTLSRSMIQMLAFIRDYGAPRAGRMVEGPSGTDQFIPAFRALERRGLAYHSPHVALALKGDAPCYFLTRPGELVCDLLVEAGLISPRADRLKEAA